MFPRTLIKSALAVASVACLAPPAWADDLSDRFDVHGYGSQSYYQTSDNAYLGADRRGSWDNNFLAFVVAASLNDKSKLWAQMETSTASPTRFTWFFLDYQLSEDLRAHAGRVKMPLGLYNEIIDAKLLHQSNLSPSLYQVAADMVHDAYHGVGLDYEQDIGAGHVLWQIYAGNVYDVDPPEDTRDRRVLGGRATWRTPVDGLRLMLSGYRTQVEVLATAALTNEDRLLASAELIRDRIDLKSEYARHKFLGVTSHAYYVQAGYSATDTLTPFARYDYVSTDDSQSGNAAFHQQTYVLGLNYRLSPNVGLRAEAHLNRGYALPVASGELVAAAGKDKWTLVAASVNFAF